MSKTALIIRFSALGDVAMTVPPVIDACRANPDTHFIFITRPFMAKVYADSEQLPGNLTVRGIDLKKYDGVRGLWRLSRELYREFKPDAVIDLHDVLRSRLISLFLKMRGARISRIDKGRSEKRALTRAKNKIFRQLTSGDSRYRDTFARGGFDSPESFDGFFSAIRKETRNEAPRIAIAPFAAHAGKEWPVRQTEEVVKYFAEIPGAEIFIFGAGPREGAIIAEWGNRWSAVRDMCSRRAGLKAEMEVMARCDVMLSMDSANMHLASLVGCPVVSVWGATHPYAGFLGWRQRPEDVVQANDLSCRPCSVFGNKKCLHSTDSDAPLPCLAAIKVKDVIDCMLRHIPSLQPPHSQKQEDIS